MGTSRRKGLAFVAAVVIAAVAGGVGWMAGSASGRVGQSPSSAASTPSQAASSPAGSKLPPGVSPLPDAPSPVPEAVSAEQAKTFTALQCQARQFNGTLALAVTFSQPVDRQADLRQWVQVRDAGRVSRDSDEPPVEGSAPETPTESGAIDAQLRQSSKPVAGSWVVGDDARVVYFPYVQPDRRYLVQFGEGLKGGQGKSVLAAASHCDMATEVMPAAFYFASKGVVLPAGQNGGLPVATVNVAEVDVQFLRIDPAQMPDFFETILGVPAPRDASDSMQDTSSADDDGEGQDYEDGGYSDSKSLKGLVGIYDLDRLRRLSKSVFQGRFMTDPTPDRRNVTFLPVERIEALKAPGIYVAVMTQPGRFQYESQVTYFYVSDIGLHARRYENAIDAFMVSLTTGQPQTDVDAELVDATGKVLAQGRTNANGHVHFDGRFDGARVLRAVRGKEMTVLALGEPALDLSEFDVGGLPSTENKLFVYAGRNLYRPGETFSVSVLARDPDGKAGASVPLTATIKRADGRTVRTALWQPVAGVPGYSEQQIVLPDDAQTGAWRLELRVDPAQRQPDVAWTFQVEEFLPERMKLTLNAPDPVPAAAQAFSIAVQGDYLYGAPAAGNRLLSTLQTRRDRMALPNQWPGFVFGDVDDDSRKSFRELEEQTLDDTGAAELDVAPDLDGVRSPMKVRLSASLLESGGRPIVRSLERTIWPADTMIAVRPLFEKDVTREGAPANFEFIRVNQQGELAPVSGAKLKLFKEKREYYWRFDDQRGWNSGYTESEDLLETRELDLKGRLPVTLPVNWGRYRIEVEDPATGAVLRYRFYAGWDAQDAETLGNRPDRVQMQLSGTPATPGEKIRLKLTPPHDGQALITVEGGSQLWSKWVPAQASGTEVEIPLDAAWRRQDLYVTAVVFRPGNQGDRVTPARAVGMAYIPMANDKRRLDVALDAPAKVLPDTRAQAQVTVKGAQPGQQVYVTVSAVDVGILNINRYATPDPFGYFFGKHRYTPELLDMYGKLIEKMTGVAGRLRWGGDADQRGDSRSLPKKVKLVDIFSGLVKLDDQGRATVALAIPDFNGTLRLMAVAFDDQRYGNAEREMQVAAPVIAELSTPRFITPGDEAAIALDVTNMSGVAREVTIDLQADAPLRIADGRRTIKLADKQRTILRFVATGTGGYGPGLIKLGVDAAAVKDASGKASPAYKVVRESILQVQAPYAQTRKVEQVRIAPGETFTVPPDWTASLLPETTTMSVALSSSLPFDVPRLVRDLLTYPYGCTEQTISAAMPWLLIDDKTAEQYKLKIKGDIATQRQTRVAGAISRLAGMRNGAGAYSLWGSGERDVWITTYATSFLQSARAAGFAVPDRDLDVSRQWLLTTLQRSHDSFGTWSNDLRRQMRQGAVPASGANVLRNDHQRFAGLAGAAWVLARDGRAPLSTVRVLFDGYAERARSPLPLVHLAVAFKLLGDAPRAQKAAELAMTRDYGVARSGSGRVDEWLGDYGSPVRDLAMSYALLTEHDLAPQRREALLPLLATRLSGRTYFSTQEQLALILAAQATGSGDKPWQVQLQAAATDRTIAGKDTEALSLPAQGASPARITNTGQAAVFASFDVQGTADRAPVADRRTVDIQRTWYRPDGRAWDGGALRTGDMMVVHLRAKSRALMPDALIVDQVPAGMEVENMNLSQGPGMDDWKIAGKVVAQAMTDTRISHTEFRDDRYVAAVRLGEGDVDVFYMVRVVTPGRFAVPATTVEAMYRPELRATGDTWRDIDIRDREAAKP